MARKSKASSKKSRKKRRQRSSKGGSRLSAPASEAELIEIAKEHHRSRDFPKAEEIYRSVLSRDPNNAEALHYLGVIFLESGKRDLALSLIVKSIKNNPKAHNYYHNLSLVLKDFVSTSYSAELDMLLAGCFSSSGLEHQLLALITAKLLALKYSVADSALETIDANLIEKLSLDSLFIAFLKKTYNVDAEMEEFLTKLRRTFLLFPENRQGGPEIPALMSALAEQCLNNEFVFYLDAREEGRLAKLKISFKNNTGARDGPSDDLKGAMPVLAMYGPLYELPEARELAGVPLNAWPPSLQSVVRRSLHEPLEEEDLKETIASISGFENETSQAVGMQYEENPYPRWLSFHQIPKVNFADNPRLKYPNFDPPSFLRGRVESLIAGSGTGKEPIFWALAYDNLNISAIDLSKSSLAYAVRMARKMGADNVEFRQDDILSLSRIDRRFHFISSVGVLHHMERPIEGWKILAGLLLPGGVMKIGLYSETARRHLAEEQEKIQKAGFKSTKGGIRKYRKETLAGRHDPANAWLFKLSDFYSFSTCRDLLFHVMEHRFTIPMIGEILEDLNLTFIGFDLPMQDTNRAYRQRFPEDPDLTNLALWEKFEEEHPDTFSTMYQFWCQKREAGR